MQKMGKLAGKTVFITGASRGIGKAIGLRAAKDGANVVIAAKTVVPHPKLPGTIFTAATEMEQAGGQALPLEVDIRHEESVKKAVDDTVARFGGIDILVNNASAINLVGTVDLDMKRYDLMHNINTRGTYLCSKYCVPHLLKSSNPHILNISPPLNMKPHWFSGHVAYTMAKYGMSMCVLGMAEEFKEEGIAVNALWPYTAIYTAAMEMLGGGESVKSQCRTPDIMSDAAHAILTKDSRTFTGQFLIDEDVLRNDGVTDLDQYACVKGGDLLPDFFLDVETTKGPGVKEVAAKNVPMGSVSTGKPAEINSGNAELDKTLKLIQAQMSPDLVKTVNAVFLFDLADAGQYFMDLKNGSGAVAQGAPADPEVTMTLSADNFVAMVEGSLNPTNAFMSGKLKIKGNLGLATKLEKVLKQARAKL